MTMVSDPRFETKDPRFDGDYSEAVAPPAKRSPWMTCLIGCLVVVVVVMLLLAAVAYWVWHNRRDLAATIAAKGVNQMIDATDLPAQERREMKLEVQRVADAYREGRLSNEQAVRIMEELVDSPIFSLFVVSAIDNQYLKQSGLSEEEKAEGRQTLQRFVRGAVDDKIDQAMVDSVMEHVADKRPDGRWRLRDKVSDEQLRAALAEAKRAADEAGIPEQPETVDASAEFKRIVDKAMGENQEVGTQKHEGKEQDANEER
jgi:hypothetical protein